MRRSKVSHFLGNLHRSGGISTAGPAQETYRLVQLPFNNLFGSSQFAMQASPILGISLETAAITIYLAIVCRHLFKPLAPITSLEEDFIAMIPHIVC